MQEMMGTNALPIEILLVEDSPGDVLLTREALRDAKIRLNLQVAADGEEAMALLRREGKYARRASSGPGFAGPELAEKRWQRSAAGNQGGCESGNHSGSDLNHFSIRGRYSAQLPAPCQLLRYQTCGPGTVFNCGQEYR